VFLSKSERPSFVTIQHNWQKYSFFSILMFSFFDTRREDKRFWTE
jgi:hypothetical protein